MELTLLQLLGMAERAVSRSAPDTLAKGAFLRRLRQLRVVAQNVTLRSIRIDLEAATPGDPGLTLKSPCEGCEEKKTAKKRRTKKE